jgi:hypothetical protein
MIQYPSARCLELAEDTRLELHQANGCGADPTAAKMQDSATIRLADEEKVQSIAPEKVGALSRPDCLDSQSVHRAQRAAVSRDFIEAREAVG